MPPSEEGNNYTTMCGQMSNSTEQMCIKDRRILYIVSWKESDRAPRRPPVSLPFEALSQRPRYFPLVMKFGIPRYSYYEETSATGAAGLPGKCSQELLWHTSKRFLMKFRIWSITAQFQPEKLLDGNGNLTTSRIFPAL